MKKRSGSRRYFTRNGNNGVITGFPSFSSVEEKLLKSMNEYSDDSNIQNFNAFSSYSNWYIQFVHDQIKQYVASTNNRGFLSHLYSTNGGAPDGTAPTEVYSARVFESLEIIAQVLKTKDSSLRSMSIALGGMRDILTEPSLASACCHHIFTLVSWITMLYTPSSPQPEGMLQLSLKGPTKPTKRLRSTSWVSLACDITPDVISQPFLSVLHNFGDFIPKNLQKGKRHSKGSDSIIASNLSYHAIAKVGHIRIEWVKAISLHLEFDERTSVLKVFQYPSFCAMLCLGRDSNTTIFSQIFSDSGKAASDSESSRSSKSMADSRETEPYCQGFFAEVICSYRLLFGQHKRAIKEFRKIKSLLAGDDAFEDPLLQRLCGMLADAEDLFDQIDAPRIKTLYSTRADFPFLGKKILALHEFINSQNPSDLKTLWYDRRDVLRFYTF